MGVCNRLRKRRTRRRQEREQRETRSQCAKPPATEGAIPETAHGRARCLAIKLRRQARAQDIGRDMMCRLAQSIAEIGRAGGHSLAFGTGLKMAFCRRRIRALQFAIQIALGAQGFLAAHRQSFAISRKVARARASRDITVPMGTSVTAAISR